MDSVHVELKASEWLARRDRGDWGEADEKEFANWQSESTAHRIAVIRLRAIWQQADRLRALGAGVPHGQVPAAGHLWLSPLSERDRYSSRPGDEREYSDFDDANDWSRRRRIIASRLVQWRAWAAVILLAIGTAGALYFVADDPNLHRSSIGEVKVVPLDDGSMVTLNTNSVIHVHLTGSERRIDLERGEAFFEVAKDARRPFFVNSMGKRVIAVGTQFSVFLGPVDTRIVVTEGQVKVEEIEAGRVVGPSTQLSAGSVARAGSAAILVKKGSIEEAETYVSWRAGYITFRDMELHDAVTEFNRYNKKQLVIGDPAVARLRVSGNLRAANVEAFVRVLEQGFPVRAEYEGDRIVLEAKEPR